MRPGDTNPLPNPSPNPKAMLTGCFPTRQAILTGESEPVMKELGANADADAEIQARAISHDLL